MGIINLIVGLVFIGIGFLVKAAPILIAGYNTMSKEKKENVDIEGLSTFLRNGLIVIGLVIIFGYIIFDRLELSFIANSIILFSTFGGIIFIVIKSQKFDHNTDKSSKVKSWLTYLILSISAILVFGFVYSGRIPSKILIENDQIEITGQYGLKLEIKEITKIELKRSIPRILRRTNGFAFDVIRKGTFKLEKFGKCKLFLHSENPPYILIRVQNGEMIIINFKNSTETENIFNELKTLIKI